MPRQSPRRSSRVDRIICPKCGWDGTTEGKHDAWFRFVEDVTNEHRIEGVTDGNTIEIAAEAVTVHGDEPVVRCGDCGLNFPLPKSLKVRFV